MRYTIEVETTAHYRRERSSGVLRRLGWLIFILLTGCSGGAVVFAPTPAPPDQSPTLYTHPSGAFTVILPRHWAVYEQNTTVLAAAAFSPPGADAVALRFAVMNSGTSGGSAYLAEVLDRYQGQIRPDIGRYHEVDRQAMGDGSWRLTGLRQVVGGGTEQINTFIQQVGSAIGVIEVMIPADPARLAEVERVVNSFSLGDVSGLQQSEPTALAYGTEGSLELLHVMTWTTPSGVFFITGEAANRGTTLITDVPVRAALQNADGLEVVEALDTVMGYGIPPGGFAPFSLRFGQGQPALTTGYTLALGNAEWQSQPERVIYGADELTWSDESVIEGGGTLVITGSATNIYSSPVRELRAVATIFDSSGNVIAAGFSDFAAVLNPNEAASFRIAVPEMGGQPANYILTIQGRE